MYKTAVENVIKDSIKSAIYIDEKAWEPFTEKPDTGFSEVDFSEQIYNNFKNKGISAAIRAFQPKDVTDEQIKNYFFEKRDLVLLDWKLNGETGEDFALKLLSDIVKRPNIHFCSIYTSDDNFESILGNILSFFSGFNKTQYEELKLDLTHLEDEIKPLFPEIKRLSYNIFNNSVVKEINKKLFNNNKDLLMELMEINKNENVICSLIRSMYSIDDTYQKSEESQFKPSLISLEQRLVVINNTIITILQKNETTPENIINVFTQNIIDFKDSFISMLGLEMQNILSKTNSLIDSNEIRISKNALIKHRKHINRDVEEYISTFLFNETIKKILIQNVDLKIKYNSFKLLEKEVLDEIEKDSEEATNDELVNLNVFYNSICIKNKKRIDFGDVFKHGNDYYLCINALCDNLRPEKNKWQFFLVKGEPIKLNKALKLGDTAFISYIDKNLAINWINLENDTEDGDLTVFKYKPVYSKPLQYLVESPEIDNGKIVLWKAIQAIKDKLDIERIEVEYITTIKENYTQRIANHAFTHPIRVGVDFVSG